MASSAAAIEAHDDEVNKIKSKIDKMEDEIFRDFCSQIGVSSIRCVMTYIYVLSYWCVHCWSIHNAVWILLRVHNWGEPELRWAPVLSGGHGTYVACMKISYEKQKTPHLVVEMVCTSRAQKKFLLKSGKSHNLMLEWYICHLHKNF